MFVAIFNFCDFVSVIILCLVKFVFCVISFVLRHYFACWCDESSRCCHSPMTCFPPPTTLGSEHCWAPVLRALLVPSVKSRTAGPQLYEENVKPVKFGTW